jgi:hypothetical protein
MNRTVIVSLIQKNIDELILLTRGFAEMNEYPGAILDLAQHKTEDIRAYIEMLRELKNAATGGAATALDIKGKDVEVRVDENTMDIEETIVPPEEISKPGIEDVCEVQTEEEKEEEDNHDPEEKNQAIKDDHDITNSKVVSEENIKEVGTLEIVEEEHQEGEEEVKEVREVSVDENIVDNEETTVLPQEKSNPGIEEVSEVLTEEEEEEEDIVEDESEEEEHQVEDEDDIEDEEYQVEDEEPESEIITSDEKITAQKEEPNTSQAPKITTLGEKMATGGLSRNDSMARENNGIHASIANKKVDDIRQAISLGDRFRFQRELFRNNGEDMNKTLSYINLLATYDEVVSFLQSKYAWPDDNATAKDFYQIIRRKF